MDVADQLSKLLQLKKDGVLSEQEFEDQRKAVLARSLSAVGARPVVTPVVGPATTMGAYLLFEQVGEGGMGRVYRGRHRVASMATRQGGDVAVKLLHEHLTSHQATVDRFRQEAEALATLEHPNIVRVYDVVEESGRIALVMEWVPGRPLSQIIGSETGPIPWERAWGLIKPVLSAVRHAHSRSVIHRDLKPDNIRVTPEGKVKVLDFGIARLGEARGRTKTGTGMGTIDYMAPEQYANAHAVDARADVYALGMTLYEMLAGRLPWDKAEPEFNVMQRKHRGEIDPPTIFYPAIPPWVVKAVMRALVADPANRTGSVAVMAAELEFETQVALPTTGVPGVAALPRNKPVGSTITGPPEAAKSSQRTNASKGQITPSERDGGAQLATNSPRKTILNTLFWTSGETTRYEYWKHYLFFVLPLTAGAFLTLSEVETVLPITMAQKFGAYSLSEMIAVSLLASNAAIFSVVHLKRFRDILGVVAGSAAFVFIFISIFILFINKTYPYNLFSLGLTLLFSSVFPRLTSSLAQS